MGGKTTKVHTPYGTNQARQRLGDFAEGVGYLTPQLYDQFFTDLSGHLQNLQSTGQSSPLLDMYNQAIGGLDYQQSALPDYVDWSPSQQAPELERYQMTDAPDFYGQYHDATTRDTPGAEFGYGGSDISKYVQQAQDAQLDYLNRRFDEEANQGLARFGAMGLGSSSQANKFLQQNQQDLAEISNRYGADAQLQGLGLFYDDRNRYSDRLANMWAQENQLMAGQNQFNNQFNLGAWNDAMNREQGQNQFQNQFNLQGWDMGEDRRFDTALANQQNTWNMFQNLGNSWAADQNRRYQTYMQPLYADQMLAGGQPIVYREPSFLDTLVGIGQTAVGLEGAFGGGGGG